MPVREILIVAPPIPQKPSGAIAQKFAKMSPILSERNVNDGMVSAQFRGSSVILRLDVQRIEMTNVRTIREEVRSNLSGRPSPVWLDLSNTTLLDSSGIGTLKLLSDEVKEYGGQLILLNMNKPQIMMLKLSKLDSLFQFEENRTEPG